MVVDWLNGEFEPEIGMRVQISGFSVVVLAEANNPTIINPDFLQYNGIVDRDRQSGSQVISTPAFSQVAFEGGLVVTADPDGVVFDQSGTSLEMADIACLDAARAYVKTVPHVPYRAVGLNPKAYVVRENSTQGGVSEGLISRGAWMTFRDTMPTFAMKATYEFHDKRMTLDISEGTVNETSAMIYRSNIHREIAETNQQMRTSSLLSILDSWENDLSDFRELVEQSLSPK